MTSAQLDQIIAQAGDLTREVLAEIQDGILEQIQGKLVEASEQDCESDKPRSIKVRIPLALVIRLDVDPPAIAVVASARREWSAEVGNMPEPKSNAERQRDFRLRQAAK
jgi:hypothetical protein